MSVPVLSTTDLSQRKQQFTIVDVRTRFEFNTIRITGAVNIPVNDDTFVRQVNGLVELHNRPLVFYCNGKTCYKAYQAVDKAMAGGVKNAYAYDSGIFEWASTYPDQTELFGVAPLNPERLLAEEDFSAHCLSPGEFSRQVRLGAKVFDLRDHTQSQGVGLFIGSQRNYPLSKPKPLERAIKRALMRDEVILAYDNAGKQVRWFQYMLEDMGAQNYYFMCGGAKAFYRSVLKAKG